PGRPPATALDPDLFFTAPSTPVRAGGSRLPLPPPEEQTDGESEGLCSPPTSPSGSYMTAEGGSWGSSGTASTSPSCSPNLVAEAEAEAEGMAEAEAMAALPTCLEDPPAFTPPSPEEDEEEEDGPFTLPGDVEEEEDDDGQTPEEEEEEEWEVSGGEGLPGAGLIPAALLPFRGSLLFQAEAVEITPLPPGTAPLPLSGEEDEEEEEEEEEEGGSTSASFLRSLSETSITEGVDESFAFRDDTSASSDSAAYDGEEDERLYGTERHALGAEGGPPGTTTAPPGTDASGDGGIELHLHAGMAPPSGPPSPEGSPRHRRGEEPVSATAAMPGAEEETEAKDDSGAAALGEGPSAEPVASGGVPQPPALCSGEPREPQTDGPGVENDTAPANGDLQGGPGSDDDDDGDSDHELGTVRAGSTEPAAIDGHDELDTMATDLDLAPSVTPSPPDEPATVATDLAP
ncbi:NAC-alpha domain-containing protein 1, partial [Spheniscus humboldti]